MVRCVALRLSRLAEEKTDGADGDSNARTHTTYVRPHHVESWALAHDDGAAPNGLADMWKVKHKERRRERDLKVSREQLRLARDQELQ